MSIEIVKPSIVDNIEFYISSDGTQSGVSISGLARLCGVDRKNIQRIVGNDPATKTGVKPLETFTGNVFHLRLGSTEGAKIITTEAATEIVFHYAFDSKMTNAMAKFSAREFAKQGMHSWIKEVTGFTTNNSNTALSKTLNELYNNVNLLTAEMRQWRTVRRVADDHMEGVNILFEEINRCEEENLTMNDLRSYTLLEWLEEEKGINTRNFSHGNKTKLGRSVSETYKALKQTRPSKTIRKIRNRRTNNITNHRTNAYTTKDFPILEVAYNDFLSR